MALSTVGSVAYELPEASTLWSAVLSEFHVKPHLMERCRQELESGTNSTYFYLVFWDQRELTLALDFVEGETPKQFLQRASEDAERRTPFLAKLWSFLNHKSSSVKLSSEFCLVDIGFAFGREDSNARRQASWIANQDLVDSAANAKIYQVGASLYWMARNEYARAAECLDRIPTGPESLRIVSLSRRREKVIEPTTTTVQNEMYEALVTGFDSKDDNVTLPDIMMISDTISAVLEASPASPGVKHHYSPKDQDGEAICFDSLKNLASATLGEAPAVKPEVEETASDSNKPLFVAAAIGGFVILAIVMLMAIR